MKKVGIQKAFFTFWFNIVVYRNWDNSVRWFAFVCHIVGMLVFAGFVDMVAVVVDRSRVVEARIVVLQGWVCRLQLKSRQ
jgi:hypothetical protein